jgi:dihydropteroate synthase
MHLLLGADRVDVTHRAVVVGILNRTTDSFYDGGAYLRLDPLLRRADALVGQGADVLEVGARPGGVGVADVSVAQESELAASAVACLRERFAVPLAVDTTRAVVAAEAFRCGAVLGNDMSGFRDPMYLPAAVAAGAAVVATHIRLPPGVPDPDPVYEDVVEDVLVALRHLAGCAVAAGLPAEAVVVDPGLDLGKTWQQSVEILAAFDRFAGLGHPLLCAASHKIFLGRLLGLETSERHLATVAACTAAALRGARLLRVHDAAGARQAADLVAALLASDDRRGRPPP